jgi:hypothetical protein
MLWLLQSSQVLLYPLPESIVGVLHELVSDLTLVPLPIMLSHYLLQSTRKTTNITSYNSHIEL